MDSDRNKSMAEHVGERIKFYRKQNRLTQEQLANKIHKTKSTLSKYESGRIPIDVDSLYEIASVLGVDIFQFVDLDLPEQDKTIVHGHPFGGKENLYIYYYDGRTKRIVKTFLKLRNRQAERNQIPCSCYMDAPSFQDYEKCKYYYTGIVTHFELVSYVTLLNKSNPMEQIGLCILNPFHNNRDTWGFMFGISYNPITPFALKFLLSVNQIPDARLDPADLELTKSELKMIKNLNMMLLNTQEP